MSKPYDKQTERLQGRRSRYVAGKNNSTKSPGSMNSHKSFPLGAGGRRTTSKIKADSRAATSA